MDQFNIEEYKMVEITLYKPMFAVKSKVYAGQIDMTPVDNKLAGFLHKEDAQRVANIFNKHNKNKEGEYVVVDSHEMLAPTAVAYDWRVSNKNLMGEASANPAKMKDIKNGIFMAANKLGKYVGQYTNEKAALEAAGKDGSIEVRKIYSTSESYRPRCYKILGINSEDTSIR